MWLLESLRWGEGTDWPSGETRRPQWREGRRVGRQAGRMFVSDESEDFQKVILCVTFPLNLIFIMFIVIVANT